jgi:hypothetical protein
MVRLAAVLIALFAVADQAQASDPLPMADLAATASAVYLTSDIDWGQPLVRTAAPTSRGALLPALYVSLAGLNVFDAYSTSKGLALGATEQNPLLKGIAGSPAAMWAVKGGATAVSIYMAERLWRKHRRAEAIAVMVISNGMMAAVAARNSAVLGRAR